METIREYTIETLTEDTVNIIMNDYEVKGKVKEKVGKTKRVCFNNIPYDRERMQNRLPQDTLTQIYAVWGDTPAHDDPTVEILVKESEEPVVETPAAE